MRKSVRAPWSIVLLVLGGLLSSPVGAAQADDAAGYRIIGYVADGPMLPPISAGKLDVINFAFANVNEAHEVFLPHETASASLAGLVKLREQNPRLQILLSIGGWGAGNFSEAAASESARARFADTAVELVRRHDLDGLDIDWEYPTLPGPGISHSPADKHNFTLMLEAVRAKLDALEQVNPGREYLLTIAAADGEAARGLEIKPIAAILDWINLMTYDFYGSLTPTTGHHAGLHRAAVAPVGSRTTEQAVDEFLKAGTPARKINIGAAFYGRTFGDVAAGNDGLQQPFGSDGGFVSWQEIAEKYLDRDGYVRHWDEQAQAAWLWNPVARRMISYEDPQALRAKAAFVRERGLGGIMYWEQRQDPKEQLLDVLVEGLKQAASVTP